MAVLFELCRTNIKFKNAGRAKYQELQLDNRTAQQWIFISVTRHSNSVHIGHRYNLLLYQVLELVMCINTLNLFCEKDILIRYTYKETSKLF